MSFRGKYITGFLVLCLSAIAHAAEKKVLIAALGDSTTAGTPFESDPEAPYTAWMMKKHKDWDVRNFGVSGESTDQIRARFENTLAIGPRYIIIFGGVNDIYQGLPPQNIQKNLVYMSRRAKGKFVIPILATVAPFDKASPRQAKLIRDLNTWIRKLADKDNLPLIDMYAVTVDHTNPDRLNGSPDGFHPDLGGYRAMGLAAAAVVEQMEAARPK